MLQDEYNKHFASGILLYRHTDHFFSMTSTLQGRFE